MKTFIASQASSFKLRSLLEDPASSIEEICKVLEGDPIVSAYILKVVNNSFFGFEGTVDELGRAIALLGKGQVNEMLQPEEIQLPKKVLVNRPTLPLQGFKTMGWHYV